MPEAVFLHGWGASSAIWSATLDSGWRALDLPGYGDAPYIAPYTPETLADDVAARLPPGAHDVVGWSMGGMVGLALAARHPQRVRRLALVSATPVFVARADWPHGLPAETVAAFADAVLNDAEATLLRFFALQARGGDAAREVVAVLRQRVLAGGLPARETLAAGMTLLRAVDLRAAVARVGCPCLVLHGARDLVCPPGAGEWLAAHLPQARLEWHEAGAHAPFISHPAWFAERLRAFLHA